MKKNKILKDGWGSLIISITPMLKLSKYKKKTKHNLLRHLYTLQLTKMEQWDTAKKCLHWMRTNQYTWYYWRAVLPGKSLKPSHSGFKNTLKTFKEACGPILPFKEATCLYNMEYMCELINTETHCNLWGVSVGNYKAQSK